jgi:hypothetical protein
MDLNNMVINEARWRRLPASVHADLRQILTGKQVILSRWILDIAEDLRQCRR